MADCIPKEESAGNDSWSELCESVGGVISITLNEPILLARMEQFFSPRPAALARTGRDAEITAQKFSDLARKLGLCLPVGFTMEEPTSLPQADSYGASTLEEMLSGFHRCSRAVKRAHLYFIAAGILREHPDFLLNAATEVMDAAGYRMIIEDHFYEEAETAYIKIASYWDRVGQVLDFVYFGIRQYEKDGFSSVMHRLQANYINLHASLKQSDAWKELRGFQNSENPDGFSWLVQRRNLLVHRLHLCSLDRWNELHPIFNSAYNHLDQSFRTRLKPRNLQEELEALHSQLDAAARLLPYVLDVCEAGIEIVRDRFKQMEGVS